MKSPKGKNQKTVVDKVKTSALVFKHLPQETAQEYIDVEDVATLSEKLCNFLQIDNISFEVKSGVILDYYVSAMWWGKQQGFDSQKLSGLYSIVFLLLDGISKEHLSLTNLLVQYKQLLTGIGFEEIPDENTGGLEFFTVDDAKNITEFLTRTIFQHYNLFQFIFTCSPAEEILGTDVIVEVPPFAKVPFPSPLVEGIPLDDYDDYIKPPEPQDTEEQTQNQLEGDGIINAEDKSHSLTSDEILALLTPAEVQRVIDEVCHDMLGSTENEIAVRLRDKENHFISKINVIHRIQD